MKITLALTGLFLGSLTACGGSAPTTRPPPIGPRPAVQMSVAKRGVATYPGKAGKAPSDRLSKAVAAAARRAAKRARRRPPKLDAVLSRVARDVTRGVRDGRTPGQTAIDFVAGHHGIIAPIPMAMALETEPGVAEGRLAAALEPNLRAALKSRPYTRMGVGRQRLGGKDVVVVLLQRSRVRISAFPRTLPSGGKATLSGALLGDLKRPQVHLTDASGKAHTLRAKTKGQSFKAAVRCRGRGAHRLEVMGSDAAGPSVAANFSFWCGTQPPRTMKVAGSDEGALSNKAAARRLFELSNAERKKQGLAALKWHDGLAKVARGHSVDMADHNFVAHVSKRTGSPGDRVRRGNLAAEVVMENVGLSDSAGGVHAGLMNSPAHRGAILAPNVDRMGVGVVIRKTKDGGQRMYATELFMRTPRPVDAKKGRAALVRALEKRRLKADSALARIAQQAAERVAQGRSDGNGAVKWAVGQVKKKRLKLRRMRSAVAVGRKPAQMAKAAKGKRFGAGVAAGRKNGQPVLFTVLLLAE